MSLDKPKRGQPGYVSPLKGKRSKHATDAHMALMLARSLAARRPVDERFWEKVDKGGANGCWLWTGCVNTDGYGKFAIGCKMHSAHHFPWRWAGKEIPKRPHVLDHICKLRRCVNPEHLRVVTQRENSTIYAAKGEPNCSACGKALDGANLALVPRKALKGKPGRLDTQRLCLSCYPQLWRYAVVPRKPPPFARLSKAETDLLY